MVINSVKFGYLILLLNQAHLLKECYPINTVLLVDLIENESSFRHVHPSYCETYIFHVNGLYILGISDHGLMLGL